MYCTHCGKPIDDNTKFCSYCGHGIERPTATDISHPPAPSSPPDLPNNHADIQTTGQKFASSEATAVFNDSYDSSNRTFKQVFKRYLKQIFKWYFVIPFLILLLIVGFYGWCTINFPGANIDDIIQNMSLSSLKTSVSLGSKFSQQDLAITPVEVTYVSNSLYYDAYGKPYVSIDLDIACLSGTWKPEYENIMFWLNNSTAFSQPSYDQTEIKRGQTHRYTFSQPLITLSTQDVDMRLILKCKTGAVVELYFSVDGVQEFFNGGSISTTDFFNPQESGISTDSPSIINDLSLIEGTWHQAHDYSTTLTLWFESDMSGINGRNWGGSEPACLRFELLGYDFYEEGEAYWFPSPNVNPSFDGEFYYVGGSITISVDGLDQLVVDCPDRDDLNLHNVQFFDREAF